jgi:hypothetical protein
VWGGKGELTFKLTLYNYFRLILKVVKKRSKGDGKRNPQPLVM